MDTHCDFLVNRLFVSFKSQVLIGVSCQLFICLHCVKGTHCGCIANRLYVPWSHGYTHLECVVNRLFVSMVSRVLIGSVL